MCLKVKRMSNIEHLPEPKHEKNRYVIVYTVREE